MIQNNLYKIYNHSQDNFHLNNLQYTPMLLIRNFSHFAVANALDNFPISSN